MAGSLPSPPKFSKASLVALPLSHQSEKVLLPRGPSVSSLTAPPPHQRPTVPALTLPSLEASSFSLGLQAKSGASGSWELYLESPLPSLGRDKITQHSPVCSFVLTTDKQALLPCPHTCSELLSRHSTDQYFIISGSFPPVLASCPGLAKPNPFQAEYNHMLFGLSHIQQ